MEPLNFLQDTQSPATALCKMGGKASQLWRLSQAGLAVPDWFCIDADLFQSVRLSFQANLNGLDLQAYAERGQTELARLFPAPALQAALSNRLQPDQFYAVRSSAIGEDSQQDSFAGQFESWLYVPSNHVLEHVLSCWQSAFAPRLLSYLQERQIPHAKIQMAVVVQKMVDARAAGVMFMANPMGALTEVVINAGYGLGEGIVSDQVEADSYIYDRLKQQWHIQLERKLAQIRPQATGHTHKIPVIAEQQDQAVLDESQRQQVLQLGQRVQNLFTVHQDIEWALDQKGQLWLLQSRPITTLPTGQITIFDNSNVVESYPGMCSPLTFSWILYAYGVLFRNGVLRLGVPNDLVHSKEQIFENMLGHLNGRVYYNLSNWYAMFRLIPGTEKYIQVWEEMMGIEQPSKDLTKAVNYWQYALPWLKISWRLLLNFLTLGSQLTDFKLRFRAMASDFWKQDHLTQEPHQLLKSYQDLCLSLLPQWDITLLNDGYAFIFAGLSKHLLKRSGFADPGALFNDLLCGVVGMESVEPVHSVLNLASTVRQDSELKAELERQLNKYQAAILQQKFPDFYTALQRHLLDYGDRALAELKLETLTLREDPRQLLRWVLDYAQSDLDIARMQSHEQHIRQQAEATLKSQSRLNPFLKPVLNYCLRQAKQCINQRESARLDRARAFGLIRHLFRCLGQQLQQTKFLLQADDIFYLNLPELKTLIHGSGIQQDWKSLIAQRQSQFHIWQTQSLPERILTQGPVGLNILPLRRDDSVHSDTLADNFLQGTACAPGLITAPALIVRNPAEAREIKGKILVAEMTDPGWVFLMIQASGLIVEKGSLLSHTAIIGRELGIPTIVGVKQATQKIKEGQMITLNAHTGQVELL